MITFSPADTVPSLSSVTLLTTGLFFSPNFTSAVENVTTTHHIINVDAIKRCKFDDSTNYSFERKIMENAQLLNYELPSNWTLSIAKSILNTLESKEIKTDFINPSDEGGCIIEFHSNSGYFLIEIYNDQEIVFFRKNNEVREAFDLNEESIFGKVEELV